jgi:hypothetical protein
MLSDYRSRDLNRSLDEARWKGGESGRAEGRTTACFTLDFWEDKDRWRLGQVY